MSGMSSAQIALADVLCIGRQAEIDRVDIIIINDSKKKQ